MGEQRRDDEDLSAEMKLPHLRLGNNVSTFFKGGLQLYLM